jgi:hypothetical protein
MPQSYPERRKKVTTTYPCRQKLVLRVVARYLKGENWWRWTVVDDVEGRKKGSQSQEPNDEVRLCRYLSTCMYQDVGCHHFYDPEGLNANSLLIEICSSIPNNWNFVYRILHRGAFIAGVSQCRIRACWVHIYPLARLGFTVPFSRVRDAQCTSIAPLHNASPSRVCHMVLLSQWLET